MQERFHFCKAKLYNDIGHAYFKHVFFLKEMQIKYNFTVNVILDTIFVSRGKTF